MRIAIVGSGISGLVAAHQLHPRHEIRLFEAADRIGGHTHTVDVTLEGRRYAVDTGFIVYNDATYPNFSRLLSELGVATQPSDMSFGLHCERSGLEWSSVGLRGLFAQPRNLLRPSFHRMLRDVPRFHSAARALLSAPDEKATLGDYLRGGAYSEEFVEHFVRPMGAAIWSADPADFLEMPAATFVRFFHNHGLLQVRGGPQWRAVCGGSARYVESLIAPFRDRIRLSCPVRSVRREDDAVAIESSAGAERFDRVVFAVHSDQALGLLADPSEAERAVLGAIRYQRNDAVLHTDASLLPRRRAARASWNYRIPHEAGGAALVTYDMNRLQGLGAPRPLLVTLNGSDRIDPRQVIQQEVVHHPVFDADAVAAQRLHGSISGRRRTHYCGAYWGYGFHEDGVRSALSACAEIGEAT